MSKTMSRTAITNLFNEAPSVFLANEITIFKTKYNEMIAKNEFKKASSVATIDKDAMTFFAFVNDYTYRLSDDRRSKIIEAYGDAQASDLLRLWLKNAEGVSDQEMVEYFKEMSQTDIECDTVSLILKDSINAHTDWKHM